MTPPGGAEVLCLLYPAGIAPAVLQALGEACLRLSSQVALRAEEAVFVEAAGSRLLFGEAGLRLRLQALGRRFPGTVAPRLGAGPHAGAALAQARYSAPLRELPLEALECYGAPFSQDEEIHARLQPLFHALRRLGLSDLGGFLDLPPQGWGERFGADAAVLRERLEGRLLSGWPRFAPVADLAEAQDLRDVETLSSGVSDAALRFHLKGVCDRLAARLRGRGQRAAGLELSLRFEGLRGQAPAPWRLALPLALPVAEPSLLQRMVTERLEAELRRRPLPAALQGLRLTVTATAPGLSAQRHAWERQEEAQEALHGLLARLAARLGEDRLYYAELLQRYLPEQAWRKRGIAVPAGPPQPPVHVARPSRLLKRPLLLTRAEGWLLHWGGGAKSRRWRALDWQGPERLGGEWWEAAADSGGEPALSPPRDYWRVRTAQSPDLWVYSRPGDEARGGALWLQGWWG